MTVRVDLAGRLDGADGAGGRSGVDSVSPMVWVMMTVDERP